MIIYLKLIGSIAVVIGFLYFILFNALRTANYMKRMFITLIITILLLVYFCIGFISDLEKELTKLGMIRNISILCTIFVYGISFIIYFIIKAKKYNHHLVKPNKFSQSNTEQFLYILYRYQNDYFLKESDEKLGAEIIKFDHKCFFYDDMIKRHLIKNNIKAINDKMYGTASIYKKKKITFYCLEVDLESVSSYFDEFKTISKLDLSTLELSDFHKALIYRMLIKEHFNIEL